MTANTTHPITVRIAKTVLSFVIIIAIGYFYVNEFRKNPLDINVIRQNITVFHFMIAFSLCLLSYLVEAVIWKSIIGAQIGPRKITFREITAILYASGLFRYLPGRIWIYSAQFVWLKKYGIQKSLILYINSVCIIELIIVSLYFGLLYMAMYTSSMPVIIIILLFASLILSNILFNCFSNTLINKIFNLVGKNIKKEIQPISISIHMMFVIQFVYTCSWLLTGLSVYFLAKGFGMYIIPADMIAVIASMSLSWLAASLAVISPGGLGVREGMMLLMLKPVLAVQAALLLPIATRVLLLLSEGLLGVIALYLGTKRNVFMLKKVDDIQ